MNPQVVAHLDDLGIVKGGIESEGPLPYLSIGRDRDDEDAARSDTENLEVLEGTHARTRVLHEGHLMGDLREQSNGAFHDVVDVDGLGEKRFQGLAFRGAHGLELGEAVNENAVAAVGRDSARGRVRLIDEPSFLQDRHVVADRRG